MKERVANYLAAKREARKNGTEPPRHFLIDIREERAANNPNP